MGEATGTNTVCPPYDAVVPQIDRGTIALSDLLLQEGESEKRTDQNRTRKNRRKKIPQAFKFSRQIRQRKAGSWAAYRTMCACMLVLCSAAVTPNQLAHSFALSPACKPLTLATTGWPTSKSHRNQSPSSCTNQRRKFRTQCDTIDK